MDQLFSRPVATVLATAIDVAPIVIILIVFQVVVLRRPLVNPARIAAGALLVLAGLSLFALGIELALLPIGRRLATTLSTAAAAGDQAGSWTRFAWLYALALALGFATTIVEPALIALALKAQQVSGGTIRAIGLRLAVAVGFGIGTALGCLRIVLDVPIAWAEIAGLLIVALQSLSVPRTILPLALDCAPVTTTTVTVPVVTALGLGLAAAIPGRNSLTSGFGLIAFASLFSIISVLAYAWLAAHAPRDRDRRRA